MIKGFLPEWVTSDFLQLSKDRDYYYNKAHKTNDPIDWQKAKSLRNKVNNLNKSLKRKFFENEIQNNINNSNNLWKTIKKILPNKQNTVKNINTKDGFTKNDTDTANELNDYFTKIGSTLASKFKSNSDNQNQYNGSNDKKLNDSNNTNDDHNNVYDNKTNSFVFHEISVDYVYNEIIKMPNNKSPGIDNICPKLLKIAAPIICLPLTYICNLSLTTSIFPQDWKMAKVTPIHKSGDKSKAENYRPISVLSIVSKIVERSVHDQLYTYLMSNNILHPSQSGFRKHHSTTTTLLDVQDFILSNMDKGNVTAALFLDLKKAFDTINHWLLIDKLKKHGISGNELSWFISYLSGRTQAVKISNSLSQFSHINIGVPQGSILGPLLFIIYVNSLPLYVNCKTVMYADDTTLLFSSSDPVSLQRNLNSNLSNIASWFYDNKLTLNVSKTKFMLFGTSKNLDKFSAVSLIFDNNIIEKVTHFKYLGVIFDSNMTWHQHIDYVSTNISKRCGIIYRVKYYLPKDVLKMLAEALIMPHFDHCSPIWSNCNGELRSTMQKAQNRLARILLSADIRTPINDMMDSLHWLQLHDRWTNQLLIIAFKCLKGSAPNYLSSQLMFTNSVHSYPTRHQLSNTLIVHHSNSNAAERTFRTRVAILWNKLPQNVRLNLDLLTLNQFKSILSKKLTI